jgi:signal recognition particle receptor subunit beta
VAAGKDGDEDAGGDEEGNWLGEYGSGGFGFGELEDRGIAVEVVGGNVREGEGVGKVEGWWEWVAEGL